MYPLIPIGPLNLSSGGLLLIVAVLLAGWRLGRVARQRGGATLADQAERCVYPVLLGAVIGGRLWYGLFNWDLYGPTPRLFLALRLGDLAWPGALIGGMLAGYLWCRVRGFGILALADSAALVLPVAQIIASLGLLLSGEAFGMPTTLPWGIPLFGTLRHPTQIYFALAAGANLGILYWLASKPVPAGTLMAGYLGLQGLTLLLVEALRADSLLLPGGTRAAQVVGLALILYALYRVREDTVHTGPQPVSTETVADTTE